MSTRTAPSSNPMTGKSPFFQQRDALVNEIALSLETVLQNMNKVNRSLEGVIAVGNEFGAVEALWSQFEGVMAQEPGDGVEKVEKEGDDEAEAEEEIDEVDGGEQDQGEEEQERPRSKGRGKGDEG